jgi:hypothetical protein
MNDPKNKKPNLGLRLLGITMTTGGGAFLGSGIGRQMRTTHGEHYYDWMIIGGIVVVIGMIILIAIRPRAGR